MKKIFLALIFICSVLYSFGQGRINKFDFEKSNWDAFKNGKVYVVLGQNNPSYDSILVSSFKKYWKFNKFEFINADKYAMIQTSPSNFFLITSNIEISGQNGYSTLSYLYISQGNKLGQLQYFTPLTNIQIGCETTNTKIELPVFIKNLDWYCNLVYSGKVTSKKMYDKLVDGNLSQIKSKPLYILDTDLNNRVKSVEDIRKDYTGKVYVVSEKEMAEIINKDEDANIFFCVGSIGLKKAFDYVYSIKTGEKLYDGFNIISTLWPSGIIYYHYKNWN